MSMEQWLTQTVGRGRIAARADHARAESEAEQSLQQLAAIEMTAVIHGKQTFKFVVHVAPEE